VAASPEIDPDLDAAREAGAETLRALVSHKLRINNVITAHYKHVDGTSFAAPIVSSIAAQIVEANPSLTPLQVKRLIVGTARRLPHVEVDKQGWGVVHPEQAVRTALPPRAEGAPDIAERRAPGADRRAERRPPTERT